MTERSILFKGKHIIVSTNGGVMSFWLPANDPAGTAYFQHAGGGNESSQPAKAILALIKEYEEKAVARG